MDIIPDGQPIQAPETGAYGDIPPTFGEYLGSQVASTIKQIGRVGAQGAYQGSGWFAQGLYGLGATEAGADVPPPGTLPSPMLSHDEYTQKYAPIGNDGKPVSLGDGPMPEAIASLIGQARREEIERENIESRFTAAHSWPINFAAGLAGFMLDPLRASTAFVPGIGEEALLSRFGAGYLASLSARLISGATAGAFAQAPISALQYGLGLEEASDYDLRSALKDIAFGAAGNAILHAGLGTAADIVRATRGAVADVRANPEAILDADGQTQHAMISTAVGQMAEGRPVDVQSIPLKAAAELQVERPPPADLAEQMRQQARDGSAPGLSNGELKEAMTEVYSPRQDTLEMADDANKAAATAAEPAMRAAEPTAEGERVRPADPELEEAERKYAAIAQLAPALPEIRAELAQTQRALGTAEDHATAAIEAGDCLIGSGI